VADIYDVDGDGPIRNVGNDSIVSDPVFPEVPEIVTAQGFAQRARVFGCRQPFAEKPEDSTDDLLIQSV
jgi:hypothetical protein